MRSPRLWVVILLMLATATVLHVRGDVDHVPASRPLSEFPMAIGPRVATDVPISAEALQILGKGDFLDRNYSASPSSGAGPSAISPIGLYIAYFPTQRTGQSIHSPQNCLPGAGWSFLSDGVTQFSDANGKTFTVGEYLITDGQSTDEALYWYQLHGRSIANDYKAKIYTLADSIRYGRTDEALVRIITPVPNGEDRTEARNRAVSFAQQLTPLLPAYVPDLTQ